MVSCEGGGGAKQNGGKAPASTGAGLKAVWMGAEAFGNVLGTLKGGNANEQRQQQQQQPQSALSREEVLQSIRQDFDVDYFVSGELNQSPAAADPALPLTLLPVTHILHPSALQARATWLRMSLIANSQTPLPPFVEPSVSSETSATWAASCKRDRRVCVASAFLVLHCWPMTTHPVLACM